VHRGEWAAVLTGKWPTRPSAGPVRTTLGRGVEPIALPLCQALLQPDTGPGLPGYVEHDWLEGRTG
jgi:hypothetical protein